MPDVKEKILVTLKPLQLSVLATITPDGKPWARYVMTKGGDDLTLRCATFAAARKVGQIAANPEVHLTCGVTDPMAMRPYLQVQGKATFTREEGERHRFWNVTLQPIFSGPDDPNYGVIVIESYRIELWTPGTFTPEVWQAE
jgi:general stress protein 26